ncbi:hypothetical protein Mpet_1476 [Methanolacinia petrolearia DSM 11571]|uniref:Uncharacterized protein n=1 Tax=Methanolacinia petrolearia (strain DSM 11571 / OCM 486 / SEBR 4847) TaxID=679926 RepID=E1RFK5_METP4|nr:hypothetical protein [Methanolacinia petrolearia]ADN36235.1 hypothetical protein Mpet_1476 [Methanolacinia petrolearia DSM 11571]
MKKQQKIISIFLVALCTIFVILTAGCTYNNPDQQENTQGTQTESVTAEKAQSTQSGSMQPTVSWKDFYPDHTDQEKSELIEDAKNEIMKIFPDIYKSTLNGEWVEHTRITDDGLEEIGRPYINFADIKSQTDDRSYYIKVDPESMEVIYYSPGGTSNAEEPVISFDEATQRAIDFIREVQGDDSIADDPDTYMNTANCYETEALDDEDDYARPVAVVDFYKTYNGVPYMSEYVLAEYEMNKEVIERYSDNTANSALLSGLTILPAEPDITFDEAVEMLENNISEEYDLDEIDLEYSEVGSSGSYLKWWDNVNIVYADDPDLIPLVWQIGISDKDSREYYQENGFGLQCGSFLVDAHTGEIYTIVYGDIKFKTYGYMG